MHVPEDDRVAVVQVGLAHADPVDVHPVEAAVVEDHRALAAARDERVAARNRRVVEHDLRRGAAADVHQVRGQRQQHDLVAVLDREVAPRSKSRHRERSSSPIAIRDPGHRARLLCRRFGAESGVGDGHGQPPGRRGQCLARRMVGNQLKREVNISPPVRLGRGPAGSATLCGPQGGCGEIGIHAGFRCLWALRPVEVRVLSAALSESVATLGAEVPCRYRLGD